MSPTLLGRYMFAARRISQLAVGDPDHRAGGGDVQPVARTAAGRPHERGAAVRHARRHAHPPLLPARRRVPGEDPARPELHELAHPRHQDARGDRRAARRGARHPLHDRRRVQRWLRLAALHGERHLPHVAVSPDRGRLAGGAFLGLGGHARPRGGVRAQERSDRGHGADAAAAAAHQLHLRSAAHGRRHRAAGGDRSTRRDRETPRAAAASSSAVPPARPTRSRARGRFSARSLGAPIAGRSPTRTSRPCCSSTGPDTARADSNGAFRRGWRGCWSRRRFLFRIERGPGAACGRRRLRDQRSGAGLAVVLLPVEQHPPTTSCSLSPRTAGFATPGVLGAQVRRMLADPRAAALARQLRRPVGCTSATCRPSTPTPAPIRSSTTTCGRAFQRETELFIESQMRDDRPLTELLTADYSYLNERAGAVLRRAQRVRGAFPPRAVCAIPARAGLLGHGSVLTVTSYATRTSPVVRGEGTCSTTSWARRRRRRRRTCRRSKTPPATGTSPLPFGSSWRRTAGTRPAPPATCGWTRWGSHSRTSTASAAGGTWTDRRRSTPRACCPTERAFDGPVEFREALLDRSGEFVRTFAEKLLTYALGRPVQHYDIPAVRSHPARRGRRGTPLVVAGSRYRGESAVPDCAGCARNRRPSHNNSP